MDDRDMHYRTEWGAENYEDMCQEVRELRVPGGKDGKVLTIGDLIDRTPKDRLAKLYWEERFFHTWYCSRTVLIGDGKRVLALGLFVPLPENELTRLVFAFAFVIFIFQFFQLAAR